MHLRHWKKRKQTLRKQTKINCSLKTTQRAKVKHRGREITPHAKMCRQKTSSKLGRPTPRDNECKQWNSRKIGCFPFTLEKFNILKFVFNTQLSEPSIYEEFSDRQPIFFTKLTKNNLILSNYFTIHYHFLKVSVLIMESIFFVPCQWNKPSIHM